MKIQFFKSFILPIFDYCSSLFIYYPPETSQSIHNTYYISLFLLFKFDFRNLNIFEINTFLTNIKLPSLLYRYVFRFLLFSKKIFSLKTPVNLFNQFTFLSSVNQSYNFRNRFITNLEKINNKFGKLTFRYFVCNLINNYCFNEFLLSTFLFNQYLINNIDVILKTEIKK